MAKQVTAEQKKVAADTKKISKLINRMRKFAANKSSKEYQAAERDFFNFFKS